MASQWHYRHGDEELGPLSFTDLRALVLSGQLAETDVVRRATSDEWEKAYRVIGLFVDGPLVAAPQAAAASNEAASLASSALPVVELAPLTNKRTGFWSAPIDRFEVALLAAMVTCLACMVGWWRWNESMEARFPAPSPRHMYTGTAGDAAPVVMQTIGNATETGAERRP